MLKNLLLVISLSVAINSNGQYCIPTSNCAADDFINNFTFNTISNLNSGASNCGTNSYILSTLTTTVVKGSTYALSVQSGQSWGQGFGVWIDYNQNQNFNDPGEFVYGSPTFSTNTYNANITIPNTALSGQTRLRVRCRYNQTVPPGSSCVAFNYGETEDYNITIQANNVPPLADFFASSTTTCSGTVLFYDQSSGSPTSWLWDFGDGTTSTSQNPVKTYSTPGTYTVMLTATNAYGNNTKTKTNYITYNSGNTPIAASCSPQTTANCCGFGITQFTFNTINNSSADGAAGYQDFTCSQTTVQKGKSYSIFVKTSTPAEHNIRAWIDYNNNGQFETGELVFSADQVYQGTGTVTIPSSVVINTGLRLRVSADYYVNSAPEPCTQPQVGQVEDYTVIIQNNTSAPDPEFSANNTTTCSGTVQFTDLSQNLPTSWNWTFGDGGTSTAQNPSHTYAASGTYTVRLIAGNSFGSDTIIKINYITVNAGASPVTASCTPVTTAYCCNYGVYNVTLGSINNTTNGGVDSYKDYTCGMSVTLNKGYTYNIQVRTGPDNPEDAMAWIDYNNDGIFTSGEVIMNSTNKYNHTASFTIPATATINTPLRIRVMSDFVGSGLAGCDNVQWGQVEDYTVKINDPNSLSSTEEKFILKIYPNPASEQVMMSFNSMNGESAALEIRDVTGRLLYTEQIPSNVQDHSISLTDFSSGLYFFTVRTKSQAHTEKILHK